MIGEYMSDEEGWNDQQSKGEKPYVWLKNSIFNVLKGIVHLNIIFSYMKFNKICNLDHPVY